MSAVDELVMAWEAAVRYRAILGVNGISEIRPHLEDMDLYGVIVEMADEGRLIGEPREVMQRVIDEKRYLPLSRPLYDPPQEIYDAALHLLEQMNVLREVRDD